MATSVAAEVPPCHIRTLSKDLLVTTFLLVDQPHRMTAIALTCKRWAAIMSQPEVWRRIHFRAAILPAGADSTDGDDVEPAGKRSLEWLSRHCASAEELHLQVQPAAHVAADFSLRRSLAAAAPAPALRRLVINRDLTADPPIRCATLGIVTLLARLTSLAAAKVHWPGAPEELETLFAGLPALRACDLSFWGRAPETGAGAGAQGFPVSLLACTALTALELKSIGSFHPGLDLGGLPDSIGALASLRRLCLVNVITATLDPAISQLTALTALDVLATMAGEWAPEDPLPEDITKLSALRHLRVSCTRLSPHVAALAGLESLTVAQAVLAAGNVTALGRLSRLTKLRVTCSMTPAAAWLPGLAACSRLQELRLDHNDLRELSKAELSLLKDLTLLDLQRCRLTGLPAELAGLSALRRLDVSLQRAELTLAAADVGTVRSLPRLERLDIVPRSGDVSADRARILSDTAVACPGVKFVTERYAPGMPLGISNDFGELIRYLPF